MRTVFGKLSDYTERWILKPFAVPAAAVLALTLLGVSELTYRDTTATLRGGIALTDQRIHTMNLLQALTALDAAEFGYLATGEAGFLTRYAATTAELPEMQMQVSAFLLDQGQAGEQTAAQVSAFIEPKLRRVEQVMALIQAGRLPEARALLATDQRREERLALRDALNAQLTEAAVRQQRARSSIYDALLVNRLAVGLLTLACLLILLMFLRRLQLRDRERSAQESALREERGHLESEVQRRTASLAELARHLQAVREDERAFLARELHDELGSLLTVCKLEIARAKSRVHEPEEVLTRLAELTVYLNKGIALKRRIIEDLRPSALADLGLAVAMDNLCEEMGASLAIPVHLSGTELVLSPEDQLAVYRFVQEALTNIGKYAQATEVRVRLDVRHGNAAVSVQDNGIGFDTEKSRAGHHGLAGMKFRAESMGGLMRVDSKPGAGTTVYIEFPQVAPLPAPMPAAD
jgi:signal transduction histidine kinase